MENNVEDNDELKSVLKQLAEESADYVYTCEYCHRILICFPPMKKDKFGRFICNNCYHKKLRDANYDNSKV